MATYTASDRALIFWLGCLPTRTTLTLAAKRYDPLLLRVFAGVVGYRWLAGLHNGNETYFGGPAWWAEQRVVHGALWLSYALTGEWRYLAADTGFGALNWLNQVA
jgi:hypothetical protein